MVYNQDQYGRLLHKINHLNKFQSDNFKTSIKLGKKNN